MMKNRILILAFSVLISSPRVYGQSKEWNLKACVEYAKEHSKKLLSQNQLIRASEFALKDSKSKLIPEIEAKVGLDYYWAIPIQIFPGELVGQPAGTHIPIKLGTPFMGNIGIQAKWTLLNPSLFEKIKERKLQTQVSTYNLRSLKQSLIRNIRMAYYQSILKEKQVEINKKVLENYKTIDSLILLKFGKGLTDKITVNQSKNILTSIQQNVTKVKLERQKALLSLKFWMGYPMQDSIHLIPIQKLTTTQIITTSFSPESLPDYSLQKSELLLAKQKLKYIRSQLYPSLSIQAGYSRLGFGNYLNFITESNWFPSGFIGVNLTIPLFSFSKTIYQPKKQKALIKAKMFDFQQYQDEGRKKFIQETMALEATLSKIHTQKEQIRLAQENLNLTRQKMTKGIIDMISLQHIMRDLNKARERLYTAKLEAIQHRVALIYLQQINLK